MILSFKEDCVFQLALAAVRNVIGLMMLGVDCGVEVDTDLFEEATTFNVLKDNSDLCQVNARLYHKLVKGMRVKFKIRGAITFSWNYPTFLFRILTSFSFPSEICFLVDLL